MHVFLMCSSRSSMCYYCNPDGYAQKYTPSSGLHCPTPEISYAEDYGPILPRLTPSTPSPSGTAYDDEALDWGSEVEEYALTSSKALNADTLTVLDHPQRSHPKAKLAPKRHGPFKVLTTWGVNCKLQLPTTWRIHPVFHNSLLSPYKETIAHGP